MNFQELIRSQEYVLVDFYAEWCKPCKQLPAILKEVKEAFSEKLGILEIDIDKNLNLVTHYKIRGVPSILLYKNGVVIWREAGVIPAGQLIATVARYMK